MHQIVKSTAFWVYLSHCHIPSLSSCEREQNRHRQRRRRRQHNKKRTEKLSSREQQYTIEIEWKLGLGHLFLSCDKFQKEKKHLEQMLFISFQRQLVYRFLSCSIRFCFNSKLRFRQIESTRVVYGTPSSSLSRENSERNREWERTAPTKVLRVCHHFVFLFSSTICGENGLSASCHWHNKNLLAFLVFHKSTELKREKSLVSQL